MSSYDNDVEMKDVEDEDDEGRDFFYLQRVRTGKRRVAQLELYI